MTIGNGKRRSRPPIVSFVASTNNTGRTGIVANLARTLSSSGERVLVLDWSTEGALVHDYLLPFQTDEFAVTEALEPDFGRIVDQLARPSAAGGLPRLRRYAACPGQLDVFGVTDPLDARRISADNPVDLDSLDRLRAYLHDAPYEYILIDSPTNGTAASLAETARLSDQVVVCFTPQGKVISSAAQLARDIRDQAAPGLQTALVACQFTSADLTRADRTLGDIRRQFADFLDTPDGVPLIKMPLQYYDDVLATIWEDPESRSAILTAYEDLSRAVTGSSHAALPAVPKTLRRRYHATLSPSHLRGKERIFLACAPADRWWAEFVSAQLTPNGIDVDWLSAAEAAEAAEDAERAEGFAESALVVIASPRWAGSPAASTVQTIMDQARRVSEYPPEIVVVVVETTEPSSLDHATIIDLTDGPSAQVAAERLFGALGIRAVARLAAPRGRVLAPGDLRDSPPTHTNALPPRDRRYFGRQDELSALRDRLLARTSATIVLLHGEAGVGKTALAREYVQWFGRDYDAVWWISAHDQRSVHEAVHALGTTLGIAAGGDLLTATLRELSGDDSRAGRWLLVYDGADDPATLADAIPEGGPGHIIVTTRVTDLDLRSVAPACDYPVAIESVAVGPLREAEAIAGLRSLVSAPTEGLSADRLPELDEDQAAHIVRAVGRLPIVIRLAGAYLTQRLARMQANIRLTGVDDPVRSALNQAVSDFTAAAAGDGAYSLVDIVAAAVQLLTEDPYGERAFRLAELCTFLAPDGVSLELLRSAAMFAQLADAADVPPHTDVTGDNIDRILWTGVRHGLFHLQWGDPEPLRMAPALRAVLRDRMTPDVRALRRVQAQRVLAGFARSTPPELPARAELARHLLPSGALSSDEWEIREWVVRQFQDLFDTGDPGQQRYAAPLVRDTLDRWLAGPMAEDRLTLLLAIQRSNLLRALGETLSALALDEAMHRRFGPLFGRDHLSILILRRGLAGSLRALGQFAQALALDQATWRMFVETHGEDHPATLAAAHNLAISWFLSGAVERALDQEREVHRHRLRIFGPDGYRTLWSATEIGIYERELGRLDDAERRLADVEGPLREFLKDPRHPLVLRVRRHLAVTRRLAGTAFLSPATLMHIVEAYRSALGPDHPYTWAATMSCAADHFAVGNVAEAVALARSALDYHLSTFGPDHPFTAVCRVNLTAFLCHAGDIDGALSQSEAAMDRLLAGLGEPHPWAIASLVNHGGVLAAQADAQAAQTGELAYSLCLEFLARDHPLTTIARDVLRDPHQHRFVDITIPET